MKLLRSFLTVGGFTGLSRVLGFVRDVLLSRALGAGAVADAFVTAFQFPNLFRRLFAEGAFSAAFVPIFARELEAGGRAAARGFAAEALSVLLPALFLLTLLVEVFAPQLARVIAWGFADDAERMRLTTIYLRIVFPYLIFMSLSALYAGILNALGKFAAAAFAPSLLNVFLIAAVFLAADRLATPGHALAWAVFYAGIAQTGVVAYAAMRAGMPVKVILPRLTPRAKRLLALAAPAAISGGALQINTLIGGVVASFTDGARSWLFYAERLYQLPLGLVGVALGVVLLPEIAKRLEVGDAAGARGALNRGLEIALLLTLPAAAGLIALAEPLAAGLFQGGAFTAADAAATAAAIRLFGCGLPMFIIARVLQPAFYAAEDAGRPMRAALVGVAVNSALSVGLYPLVDFLAIPIATGIAMGVNAMLLMVWLRRSGGFAPDARLARRAAGAVAAAVLMGAGVWAAGVYWPDLGLGGQPARIVKAVGLAALGAGLYGVCAFAFGALRLGDLKGMVRRGAV